MVHRPGHEADFLHLLSWWKKKDVHLYSYFWPNPDKTSHDVTLKKLTAQFLMFIFSVQYYYLCKIQHQPLRPKRAIALSNKQVMYRNLVFSFRYLIAQCLRHTTCWFLCQCKMLSGNWTVRTTNCAVLSHCSAYCCRNSISILQQRQAHR